MRTLLMCLTLTAILAAIVQAQTTPWDRHIIENNFDRPVGVSTGDFNGDGHIDVVASDHAPEKYVWYQNDGLILPDFASHVVSGPFNFGGFKEVVATDLDANGTIDFVSASDEWCDLTWWKNNGSGSFTQVTIDGGIYYIDNFEIGDIDGDGDLDIVASGKNETAWYEQTSPGVFAKYQIYPADGLADPLAICDFDGDGHMSLIAGNGSQDVIEIWQNDGAENFSKVSTVGVDAPYPEVYDIDADGDIDIISTDFLGNRIAWWENDGSMNFSLEHEICSGFEAPQKILVLDVDGDNDADIVSGSYYTGGIYWWENDGAGNFGNASGHEIDAGFLETNYIWHEDLDLDGREDILAAGDGGISWFKNPGPGVCQYIILSDDFTGTEIDWTKWELRDSHTCEPHGTVTQNDELIIELPETNNNCGSMGLKSRIDFGDYFGDISCEFDFHTTSLHNWQDHPLALSTPFGVFCYKNYMTRWLVLWTDDAGLEHRFVFDEGPMTEQMYHLKVEVIGGVLKFWRGIEDGEYKLVHSVPAGQFQHMPVPYVYLSQSDRGPSYYDNVVVKVMCPPEAVCQDITIAAGDDCQASGSVNAGSYDPGGRPITMAQLPDGPYPLGQTPVTLTVTNDLGHSSTCDATVTVVDLTPPATVCPGDIIAECSSAQGAAVTFEVAASDACDPAPQITCTPASGSVFPIGDTKVKCIATDKAGNKDSCSFTVTVLEGLGTIAGHVTANCSGQTSPLMGVLVDIFDSEGLLRESTPTAEDGSYEFADLPSGEDYTINLVTPLGFDAEAEEIPVWIGCNDNVTVDLNLTCLELVGRPRGIGYWKHEVGVALGGDGHEELSPELICSYLDMIEGHFNSNEINQVLLYDPPESEDCFDKLAVASDLLNLKGDVGLRIRAQQNLMAVLFNVAAGNIFQRDVISEDGASVSQAITFCDYLIDDPEGDHNLAIVICNEINHSRIIEADVIPLITPDIAYHTGSGGLPAEFSLSQNYPNPFNPVTEISFALPKACDVKLEIFNIVGQKVTTLVDGAMPAGHHTAQWNGGTSAASGFYMYRLTAGDFVETKKMVLIK